MHPALIIIDPEAVNRMKTENDRDNNGNHGTGEQEIHPLKNDETDDRNDQDIGKIDDVRLPAGGPQQLPGNQKRNGTKPDQFGFKDRPVFTMLMKGKLHPAGEIRDPGSIVDNSLVIAK